MTITILCFSCNKVTEKKGSVYVRVLFPSEYSSLPVEGAEVFTVPTTKQGITDKYGVFLLSDIKTGVYEVYAVLSGYGSGKTLVKVSSESFQAVTINLQYGLTFDIRPEIELLLPTIPAHFAPNENIVFSFNVTDKTSKPNDINVILSSDKDGKLLETHPDASNNVRFETSTLSRGTHTISITATNKENVSTIKTIELSTDAPSKIVLESATKTKDGYILLQWQKYTGTDFKRYEVFRTNNPDIDGELLASFTTIESVQFIDKLPPILSETYYYVRVTNADDKVRYSNKIKVVDPAGKIYYYSISDAVHHPSEPVIYVVDYADMKLRAINYVNQTEKSISLQGSIGKIDVGDNGFGMEVYVPNNSGFIHVYNANTLNLVTSIITGIETRCVATNGHGYIVASLIPSPWWENPVRTYSRSTGVNISGGGQYDGNMLRFVPNTDNVISITTGMSPTKMGYFEMNSSGKILKYKDSPYHGDHPLNAYIFRISNNGEFVVTNEIGAVYSASSSMIYKGMIDRGALYFSDFAFSDDGNFIYAGTSNRNSIQIVNYPQLTRSDEILTKGCPKYLFKYDGEIISISRTNTNVESFIIEKFSVN